MLFAGSTCQLLPPLSRSNPLLPRASCICHKCVDEVGAPRNVGEKYACFFTLRSQSDPASITLSDTSSLYFLLLRSLGSSSLGSSSRLQSPPIKSSQRYTVRSLHRVRSDYTCIKCPHGNDKHVIVFVQDKILACRTHITRPTRPEVRDSSLTCAVMHNAFCPPTSPIKAHNTHRQARWVSCWDLNAQSRTRSLSSLPQYCETYLGLLVLLLRERVEEDTCLD